MKSIALRSNAAVISELNNRALDRSKGAATQFFWQGSQAFAVGALSAGIGYKVFHQNETAALVCGALGLVGTAVYFNVR